MLRKDGKYTIYKIQHWIEPGGMYKDGRWAESDLNYFLKGVDKAKDEELRNQFNACGECWQETGEYGVYDSDTAIDMLKLVVKYNVGLKFRVVQVKIHQQTVGLFYYQPEFLIEEIANADL